MEIQPAPPAPSTQAALAAPVPAQIPSAETVATSPAAPAHPIQAAPKAQIPVPASPAAKVASPKTAPPAAPATSPTVVIPGPDVTGGTPVDHNTPTPAPIDTEAEEKLTAEIVKLWGEHKGNKATVRRTRAENKALRQQLAAMLHTIKAILVRSGRGGGWAPYLRAQSLPLTTADRLVLQHEATLAPREEKLTTEELSTPTVDEIRQLARKILPKVSRFLTTQELTDEFVHELIWGIDVAEMSYTDLGFEIPKIGSDDAPEIEATVAELANPAPAAP